MKKNIIFAALAAASALLLTLSCTKQDNVQSLSRTKVFTASIEQIQTKTTLDGLKVNWSEGDQVLIIDSSEEGSVYSATPKANGTAEFTLAKGKELTAPPYSAVYPSNLFQGEGGPQFNSIQRYEPGKLNTPMVAFSQTEELTFKNICGVVCFALTGSVEIESIELWADGNALCGPTEVNFSTYITTAIGTISDNNRVTLRCLDKNKKGVTLTDETTYFYIYLPVIENIPSGSLHAKIWGTDGGYKELTSGTDVTIERNNIYTFEINIPKFECFEGQASEEQPEEVAGERLGINADLLPGEFTVDADGTKVKFTSGNLLWTKEKGWTVEDSQKGTFISPFDANNVDLFLWTDDDGQAFLPTASTPTTHYLFCDDNVALFNNGTTDLHVLSYDQWNYLLNSRTGNRFAKAKVGGMPGLLLFPDVVPEGKGAELIQLFPEKGYMSEINQKSADFPASTIELVDFQLLEQAGVVFLPADGSRVWYGDDDGNYVMIDNDPDRNSHSGGYYWGVCNGGFAIMNFTNSNVSLLGGVATDAEWSNLYGTASGASIRLVQVIPATQQSESQTDTER